MNYYGKFFTIPGFLATGDLSAKQYYCVKPGSTAGTVKVAVTAASDKMIGILQNDPADGEAAEIAGLGVCKAAAEASVAVGDKLTCSTTGRVKTTTTDKDEVIGIALKAVVSAGDVIPVLLSRFTLSE